VDFKNLNRKEYNRLRYQWKLLSQEYEDIQKVANKINIKFVDYVYIFTKENNIKNPFDKIEDTKKDKSRDNSTLSSSSSVRTLYRDIMKQTHPDKKENNTELYVEATVAKKENNLHKLLDVGKKLKLNLTDISRDQLNVLESNIKEIKDKIREIKNSYPWVWFHGSQKTKHEVIYGFLTEMKCFE
tara:strand:- start:7042 stop:7596 length:555 start_codon:yes stop_codon:yes gene_type:complete